MAAGNPAQRKKNLVAYGTGYPSYLSSYDKAAYKAELADQDYEDGWDDLMYADVDWDMYRWNDDYADGVDDAEYYLYKKRSAAYSYWR